MAPNQSATLRDASKALREATENTVATAETLKKNINFSEVSEFYRDLCDHIELFETFVNLLKSTKEEYRKKIMPNLMTALKMDSTKTGGRAYSLRPEFRASIPEKKMPKALKWLEENGYPDISKTTVNAQTLTSAMLEWIRDNGKLPPDDVMTLYIDHYVSMRKA